MDAIDRVTYQASTWLSTQHGKGMDSKNIVPLSSDRRMEAPVQVGDRSAVMPESVARRFLKVESDYYFQDRTPAFSDRGSKLTTRGVNHEVVRSLVEIAIAREWNTVTIKGSEEFRRSAWMEATMGGLIVVGYKPTAIDLADLASRPANNTVEKGVRREKDTESQWSTSQQPASQPDMSHAAVRQVASTKPLPEEPQPDPSLKAKANAFQEGKPAAVVKTYPDLAAAYGIMAAARAFAADKLPESTHKEFVDMARRHMVEKIMAGEQIHGPKIYLTPTRTTELGGPAATGTTAQEHQGAAKRTVEERAR